MPKLYRHTKIRPITTKRSLLLKITRGNRINPNTGIEKVVRDWNPVIKCCVHYYTAYQCAAPPSCTSERKYFTIKSLSEVLTDLN